MACTHPKKGVFTLFHKKSLKARKIFFYSLLSSLLIHIGFYALIKQASVSKKHKLSEETEVVFVEYPPHRQIVHQKNFNKIPSQQERAYLSQADQSVEKQTQAMLKGLFHQGSAGATSFTSSTREPASKKSGNDHLEPHELAQRAKQSIESVPLQMNLEEASLSSFQSSASLSRTMDFLPGVELGSHTLLNTKEFRYYSYFSRMKEQLYWRWTTLFKEEAMSLSSQIQRGQPRRLFHTSLYVYLSPEGEIQDIAVVKSSGLESIDSIALYAFMQSAPFPNPPRGLVEEDGYIHIRQSFNLYIQPSMFKAKGL